MNPAPCRYRITWDEPRPFILWRLAVVSCLSCLFAIGVWAEKPAKDEDKVKAEYLYNFAKLVEWPTNAFARTDSPLMIGVVGGDSFDALLRDAVKGKKVGGHKIVVRHFAETNDVDQCQMLFIHRSAEDQQAAILAHVATKSILTVGETGEFLQQGGIVRFVMVEDAVRFELFLDNAERAGLRISSKLMLLARPVYRAPASKEGN